MQPIVSTATLKMSMLSVGELTACLQGLIEARADLQRVWVTGEVSSAHEHPSGTFFALKDPEARAVINCVIWHRQRSRLATLPRVGEQITVLGQVTLYAQRGSYQLTVWQAIPAGEGLQALQLNQLREQLRQEGLFDWDRKRSLPSYPNTVAIITSPQAAAWGDIQRTLQQRSPGLSILFAPAVVQGAIAPDSIQQAFGRIEQHGGADLVILARGGGSNDDLACFNDEQVVRAIAACPVPVITGIGHQRDETLADAVADVVAHTPTAAAEQAVPALVALYQAHQVRQAALVKATQSALTQAQVRVQTQHQRLQRLHLDKQWQRQQTQINQLSQRLRRSVNQRFQTARQQTQALNQTLASLNPEAVLRRGYALVRLQNDAIATAPQDINVGEEISLHWSQGLARATVTEIDYDACLKPGKLGEE
ncbi:MAG: exodeoxyribonuclease VII large subunit [Cyanobacteria bacterium P01_A01_bin.123]